MADCHLYKINGQEHLVCSGCEEKHRVNLPLSINKLVKKMEVFTRLHEDCKQKGGEDE